MRTDNSLPRCAPESQGISSASILAFVEAVEKQIQELHSFMLLRHGTVVAEGWWSPYRRERPHMLFSLSKSFTSTAVGLAVAEGRLSVDDGLLSFFPNDAPAHISKNLNAMCVRHLLSMSTGHDIDTMPFMGNRRDGNWTKAFLARPVKHKPGTHFFYNTGATYMLSAIIQKLTGVTLLEYLQPRLFEPLGIQNPTWEMSPQGINTGGFGLSITTEAIARFGQMYLQKGVWNGKRIVPEVWIEEAISSHISNGSDPASDWNQGYGYQFWRCRHGAYRGDGAFGQYCIVMPEQDAVLAMTSGIGDMQGPLNLVWEHLIPALGKPLPANADTQARLAQKLGSLAYLPPQGKDSSPVASAVSKKTFTLEPNVLKIKTMAFDFSKSDAVVTMRHSQGTYRFTCGARTWEPGMLPVVDYSPCEVASGVWSDDNTLVITLRFEETPFVYTMACHFAGDRLTIDGAVNVAFGPKTFSLVGKMQS